jgi:hypothetical protein
VRTRTRLARVRLLAAGAAVALTATLGVVLSSLPASAAAPVSPAAVAVVQHAWSYVPEFPSSPVIDTGTVVTAGHPVAGATVLLFPIHYGPVKPHTVVRPISRAITSSDGGFAIRLPASPDHVLISAGHYIRGAFNLHVMAVYPGGIGNWFVPVRAGALASTRLVLHRTPVKISAGPAACTETLEKTFPNVPVEVGFKDSGNSTLAWAQYTYSTSTSTTMGAGISYTSVEGGFSADGTTTQSAGGSFTWPHMKGAGVNKLLASGLYYDYHWICYPGEDQYYIVSLNSINSASGSPGTEGIAAGYCSALEHGDKDSYTVGTQETWGSGADLKDSGLNINLSSQDGWSTSAYLTFQAGSQNVPVCGVNNYPNANSPSAGQLNVH